MKKYIIISIACVFSEIAYTQEIAVELSIAWQNELAYSITELERPEVKPVYLVVTYRNISEKSFYFLKMKSGIYDLPYCLPFRSPVSYKKRPFTQFQNNACKSYFTIDINQGSNYFSLWEVRKDTVYNENVFYRSGIIIDDKNKNEVVERIIKKPTLHKNIDDGIFMSLSAIYVDIYNRFYPEFTDKDCKGKDKYSFYIGDITENSICNALRDRFVFLKSGETFTSKFNLIGFQLVGGNFTFQLDGVKSLDYVNTTLSKQNNSYTTEFGRKELPRKIGEYELFTNSFVSNKAFVFFEGIKREE